MALIDLDRIARKGNRRRLQEIIKIVTLNEGVIASRVDCSVRSINNERVELDITFLPMYNNYFLIISIDKGGSYQELLEYRSR